SPRVDAALAVQAAEGREHADPHRGRAVVVDIGVRLLERAPHRGEARMEEAQHGKSRLRAKRLVHGDAVDHGPVGLPEIEADHRYPVAVGREEAREDALLDLGAADHRDARIAREHRPRIRRHEADGHAPVPRGHQPAGLRASRPYIMPIAIHRWTNSKVGRRLEPAIPLTRNAISDAAAPWKKPRISGLR